MIGEFSSIYQVLAMSSNSDRMLLSFHILLNPLNYDVINVTYVLVVFSKVNK